MTKSKRPKLGDVLRTGEKAAPVPTPAAIPDASQQGRGKAQGTPPPVDAPAEKMVQLNVTVPPELRRAVRIKALQQGVEVSTVVRQLLQQWLDRK
ncbi:hypothetical protein [Deinococcus humi]|uniref:CopG family transcriptional regulator n=1 Tax=Deinococcus humi TaxID=662880 RepID=A0A7W8JX28_9DEIO|nr:hypothetical protein [Deinococcus humi]MBB5364585.1 hypothetical protein [Deinococcus humi]GGO41288.1 hypothetical protein GCM10008949_51900 [Deinococcus humi]